MATLFVVLASQCPQAGVREGTGGLALYCQISSPTTFRDASQFSHFERARALALWLEDVKSVPPSMRREMGADELAADVRRHADAVALFGADLRELQQPPETWAPVSGHAAPLGLATDAWVWNQDAIVQAFWTDPASPVLRLAARFEAILPPGAVDARSLLDTTPDAWSPSSGPLDFLVGSPGDPVRVAMTSSRPGAGSDAFSTPVAELPSAAVSPDALPPRVAARSHVLIAPTSALPEYSSLLLSRASLHTQMQIPILRYEPALRMPGRAARWIQEVPSDLFAPHVSLRLAVAGASDVDRLASMAPIPGGSLSLRDWRQTASLPFVSARDALSPRGWATRGAGLEFRASSRVGLGLRLDELTTRRGADLLGSGTSVPSLRMQGAGVNLNYSVTDNLRLQGGYIYQRTQGLYVPTLSGGSFSGASIVDERAYPYVGFNYRFNDDARWNVNVRFYNSLDVNPGPQLNLLDPKVTTEFRVRF